MLLDKEGNVTWKGFFFFFLQILFFDINLSKKREKRNGIYWEGNGKTFDENDNVIWEGEFQNGREFTGKGNIVNKQYNLEWNGELKNGSIINGKGSLLDFKDRFILTGTWENSNGNIKVMDKEKNLIWFGETREEKPWNGKGIVYNEENKLVWEGYYFLKKLCFQIIIKIEKEK